MDDSLNGWVGALASPAPTPGGGAAAALLVSVGAALIEMASGLTVGREKFKAVESLMGETLTAAGRLRGEADGLRAEDSVAFDDVSAAYKLPRGTAEEKVERSIRIQAALRRATEVPLRTVGIGVDVLELASRIAAVANPNVISDVGAGVLSARAGAEASALNVSINLVAIKDDAYCRERAAALEALLARAKAAADVSLAAVNATIGR
jgi:formiminotetrahydrofolate cyclodeaminase